VTRKQKRLTIIAGMGAVLLASVLLVMSALRDKIVFFYTPTEIVAEGKAAPGQRVRIGGLVKEGSLVKDGENVSFIVTDTGQDLNVRYKGILPDLFREGQGVVSEGTVEKDGVFVADTVLAKHDENYIPKEVADALKEQGVWQGNNQ
jgi:cytochrome c-type biogenesis protein CcmE